MRYRSANMHYQEKYGEKVYKLALKGGTTCPVRDGLKDTRGCIFCSGEGSGDFAAETIDEAIARLSGKQTGRKYIAYFQSFTGTYGDPEYFRKRYLEAAADERIAGLSIATRPDCLPTEMLDLLAELARIKPLSVELGLQTIHDRTAAFIRRGYPLAEFDRAVTALRACGAEVIVHLILGLPGETKEDMLASVRYLNGCDVQGVKLQLLHVLAGTDLGELYLAGAFGPADGSFPFTLPAYADLICDCIGALKKDITVHRITGDAPKRILLSPTWSGNKKLVLNTIRKRLEDRGITQGCSLPDQISMAP